MWPGPPFPAPGDPGPLSPAPGDPGPLSPAPGDPGPLSPAPGGAGSREEPIAWRQGGVGGESSWGWSGLEEEQGARLI